MSTDALIFDSRNRERAEELWRQVQNDLAQRKPIEPLMHISYYKMPGSLRWYEVRASATGQWHSPLGPLASKALDGELFEPGLPPTTRQVAPMVADFTALNEGLQILAAWADQVVGQLVRAFQPLPTSEGGV